MSIKTGVALLKLMAESGRELNAAMDNALRAMGRFGGAMRRTRIVPKKPWTPRAPGPSRPRPRNRPKVSKRRRRTGHHGRRKRHAQA